MKIRLKSLDIENFKGIKSRHIDFGKNTRIKGQNGAGKTTIVDAFTWLLFNKNSQYVEKFDIRTLDPNGKTIDGTDITVKAVIEIDGVEKELCKIQKQNFVKHRGSENAQFQGNVNSFFVDGYARSDREFKEIVSSMVSEDIFKILTNPTYFPNMKWKEQRDILMKLVSTESDAEVAERLGGYDLILDELKKAPSTADIQKKYKTMANELKKKQDELPIRIDEIIKQKVDYDLSELELQKAELERNKKTIDSSELERLKGELMDVKFALNSHVTEANMSLKSTRDNYSNAINESSRKISSYQNELTRLGNELATKEAHDKELFERSVALGERYKDESDKSYLADKWVFDEIDTKCNVCGQMLPPAKANQIRNDFERNKALAIADAEKRKKEALDNLVAMGNLIKEERASLSKSIDEINAKSTEMKRLIIEEEANEKKLRDGLSKLPESADLSADEEYNNLSAKKNELSAKIEQMDSLQMKYCLENTSISAELEVINKKIADMSNNAKIDERVDELREEQKDTAQKVADCEKILYCLEKFVKAKLDGISATINGHFKLVNAKLFDTAINGSVTETCELTVNGVPYSSLCHSMQILAGLDVIDTLSEIYGTTTMIFVDNAEAINDFNFPKVSGQLITLSVSDNRELCIESED